MLTIALCAWNCKSSKGLTQTSCKHSYVVKDSTVINTEKTIDTIFVPSSEVKINILPISLDSLPQGSLFQEKKGNVTLSAHKEKDGSVSITANCDSLVFLSENLKKEVYHFQHENTTLKTELNTQKTPAASEPDFWQQLQIWWGRIITAVLLLWIGYNRIKDKIK